MRDVTLDDLIRIGWRVLNDMLKRMQGDLTTAEYLKLTATINGYLTTVSRLIECREKLARGEGVDLSKLLSRIPKKLGAVLGRRRK